CMESPRGLNDPALGALAEIVSRADAIMLLGKEPDFTLRFGQPPALDAACRLVVIDPDAGALHRALDVIRRDRVALFANADSIAAAQVLIDRRRRIECRAWRDEVEA